MTRFARLPFLALVFCWGVPAWGADEPGVDYTGHKVVRVDVRSEADLQLLRSISPDIWTEQVGIRPLDARIPPERLSDLVASGLSFTVLIEDLQPLIRRQTEPAGRGTWDAYMNLDQLIAFINNLATTHPGLCEVIDIGNTIQGRDIWVLHITGAGAGPKPAVFYHGLQHCREWISGPVVLYLADYLVNNYGTDPCVTALVDRTDFYLAPCVNPDGYVYTWTTDRQWRKNRRLNAGGSYGVDLNRNWGYQWGYDNSGSSPTPSDLTYRGTGPFSEPETQALRDFIMAHSTLRAYMDYHSYSQLILWPWGYACSTVPEPDATTFSLLGNEIQALLYGVHGVTYTPSPICLGLYAANGGSADWVYGNQGKFGFSIELRDTGTYGFVLPPEQILPTCQENLPAILRLSEWASSDVSFRFSTPPPQQITAGSATTVAVQIIPQFSTVAPGTAKMFYRYDPAGPYLETALTPGLNNTYQGVLPATNCTSTPQYYFSVQSAGGQTLLSPECAPTQFYTAAMVGANAAFYTNNLDSNPGWTAQTAWAFGTPTGGAGDHGGPDPTSGHTGSNVYGYNLTGSYTNNMTTEKHLTSTAISCTGRTGVKLSFWRWLGVEQPSYDHAYVRVSNNGTTFTTIWQNTATVDDRGWVYQEFDISAQADNQPTVYLRWTMGTTDGAWTYCGWNIDDIRLFTPQCVATKGDYNGDTAVNLTDFPAFGECLTGPGGGVLPGCAIFDFLDDGDVDLDDFYRFQAAFVGS